ncbi:MAG: LAGLIDADG family homing endonuclease [bacterium]|nr:LAGLIDADG family homing endonuclease [bacterium]
MNITKIVNETGCFDLQFRRDVRHKRTGTPTYYCWKAQFVIVGSLDKEDLLRQIQNTLGCGRIHYITGTQLRYSVQDINSLYNVIVPFFKKYQLSGNKKHDFELWAEAIKILFQNKGKSISQWSKEPFQRLIDIQKAMQKYKAKKLPGLKWISIAESIVATLNEA